MGFIIDPKSLSFSQIKKNIKNYINTKPDKDKWKDFFSSSIGESIIELIAGLSAFTGYNNIVGRRESYLHYANNRSSNIAMAEFLGYSVDRGKNAHVDITVTPNQTLVLPKYSIIGDVKDKFIITTEAISLNSGIQTTIEVVVGELETEELTIPSDDINLFRFTEKEVSEDFRILLNGSELPISKIVKDLLEDKYITLSNVFDSIDVLYLNDGAFNYTTGDKLKIEYVKLNDLTFTTNDISFLYGTLDSATIKEVYKTPESIDTIKVNAPLQHETQFVIRGREDYRKTFKALDPDLADTNGRDISPAVVDLTYVKNDLTLYTAQEKTDRLNSLLTYRPFGVEPPTISDPAQVNLNLDISVTLLKTPRVINADVMDDINDITDSLEKIFEQELDLNNIEHQINQLTKSESEESEAKPYIKISRVTIPLNTWAASTAYIKGDFLIPTSGSPTSIYECIIAGTSDTIEPTFPTNDGDTVIDGTVTWKTHDNTKRKFTFDWNEYLLITNNITIITA